MQPLIAQALLGLLGVVITAGGLYLTQRTAAKANRRQAEAAAEPALVEKLGDRLDALYSQVDQLRAALEDERSKSAESRRNLRVAGRYINDLGRWLYRVTVGPPPAIFTDTPPLPPDELTELIDPTPWRSLTPKDTPHG